MSAYAFPSTIKTLLADDEPIAIARLRQVLAAYPFVDIIGEAANGPAAVAAINGLHPDLVFLDIQMPGLDGLEVLNQLAYTPLIVFVTAYENYAVKAFEKNSLDYLLKPVEEARLAITMQRILQNKNSETTLLAGIRQLLTEKPATDTITTIPVKTGDKIQLVPVADVCYFTANDKYVSLHTHDAVMLVEYPLGYLQERLPPDFFRVHRSHIVNKSKIAALHKYFKGTFILVMNDAKASKIKSAYAYSEAIKTKLLL